MSSKNFEDIALAYDRTIDWRTRIQRELPFVEKMVNGINGKRVLDLACGTGRHAVELDKRGADVVGIDSSSSMILTARRIANETNSNAEFLVGDMKDVKRLVSGSFDSILCLGNSLALLPDIESVEQVLSDVNSLLRPDGTFFFQILNFQEILGSDFSFMPPKASKSEDGVELVFFRFFSHDEESKKSTLVLSGFEGKDDEWDVQLESLPVLQLDAAIVIKMLNQAGFRSISKFSSYNESPFDSRNDRTLIVVART